MLHEAMHAEQGHPAIAAMSTREPSVSGGANASNNRNRTTSNKIQQTNTSQAEAIGCQPSRAPQRISGDGIQTYANLKGYTRAVVQKDAPVRAKTVESNSKQRKSGEFCINRFSNYETAPINGNWAAKSDERHLKKGQFRPALVSDLARLPSSSGALFEVTLPSYNFSTHTFEHRILDQTLISANLSKLPKHSAVPRAAATSYPIASGNGVSRESSVSNGGRKTSPNPRTPKQQTPKKVNVRSRANYEDSINRTVELAREQADTNRSSLLPQRPASAALCATSTVVGVTKQRARHRSNDADAVPRKVRKTHTRSDSYKEKREHSSVSNRPNGTTPTTVSHYFPRRTSAHFPEGIATNNKPSRDLKTLQSGTVEKLRSPFVNTAISKKPESSCLLTSPAHRQSSKRSVSVPISSSHSGSVQGPPVIKVDSVIPSSVVPNFLSSTAPHGVESAQSSTEVVLRASAPDPREVNSVILPVDLVGASSPSPSRLRSVFRTTEPIKTSYVSLAVRPSSDEPLDYSMKTLRKLERDKKPPVTSGVLDLSLPKHEPTDLSLPKNEPTDLSIRKKEPSIQIRKGSAPPETVSVKFYISPAISQPVVRTARQPGATQIANAICQSSKMADATFVEPQMTHSATPIALAKSHPMINESAVVSRQLDTFNLDTLCDVALAVTPPAAGKRNKKMPHNSQRKQNVRQTRNSDSPLNINLPHKKSKSPSKKTREKQIVAVSAKPCEVSQPAKNTVGLVSQQQVIQRDLSNEIGLDSVLTASVDEVQVSDDDQSDVTLDADEPSAVNEADPRLPNNDTLPAIPANLHPEYRKDKIAKPQNGEIIIATQTVGVVTKLIEDNDGTADQENDDITPVTEKLESDQVQTGYACQSDTIQTADNAPIEKSDAKSMDDSVKNDDATDSDANKASSTVTVGLLRLDSDKTRGNLPTSSQDGVNPVRPESPDSIMKTNDTRKTRAKPSHQRSIETVTELEHENKIDVCENLNQNQESNVSDVCPEVSTILNDSPADNMFPEIKSEFAEVPFLPTFSCHSPIDLNEACCDEYDNMCQDFEVRDGDSCVDIDPKSNLKNSEADISEPLDTSEFRDVETEGTLDKSEAPDASNMEISESHAVANGKTSHISESLTVSNVDIPDSRPIRQLHANDLVKEEPLVEGAADLEATSQSDARISESKSESAKKRKKRRRFRLCMPKRKSLSEKNCLPEEISAQTSDVTSQTPQVNDNCESDHAIEEQPIAEEALSDTDMKPDIFVTGDNWATYAVTSPAANEAETSPSKRKSLKLGYSLTSEFGISDLKLKRRKLIKKDEKPTLVQPTNPPVVKNAAPICLLDSSESSDDESSIFKTEKAKQLVKRSNAEQKIVMKESQRLLKKAKGLLVRKEPNRFLKKCNLKARSVEKTNLNKKPLSNTQLPQDESNKSCKIGGTSLDITAESTEEQTINSQSNEEKPADSNKPTIGQRISPYLRPGGSRYVLSRGCDPCLVSRRETQLAQSSPMKLNSQVNEDRNLPIKGKKLSPVEDSEAPRATIQLKSFVRVPKEPPESTSNCIDHRSEAKTSDTISILHQAVRNKSLGKKREDRVEKRDGLLSVKTLLEAKTNPTISNLKVSLSLVSRSAIQASKENFDPDHTLQVDNQSPQCVADQGPCTNEAPVETHHEAPSAINSNESHDEEEEPLPFVLAIFAKDVSQKAQSLELHGEQNDDNVDSSIIVTSVCNKTIPGITQTIEHCDLKSRNNELVLLNCVQTKDSRSKSGLSSVNKQNVDGTACKVAEYLSPPSPTHFSPRPLFKEDDSDRDTSNSHTDGAETSYSSALGDICSPRDVNYDVTDSVIEVNCNVNNNNIFDNLHGQTAKVASKHSEEVDSVTVDCLSCNDVTKKVKARIKGNWMSRDFVQTGEAKRPPYFTQVTSSKAKRDERVYQVMQKMLNMGLIVDKTRRGSANMSRWPSSLDKSNEGQKRRQRRAPSPPWIEKDKSVKCEFVANEEFLTKPCSVSVKRLDSSLISRR